MMRMLILMMMMMLIVFLLMMMMLMMCFPMLVMHALMYLQHCLVSIYYNLILAISQPHPHHRLDRAYTPVTGDAERGYVELLIKVYRPDPSNEDDKGGKMSQHMDALQVGQTIEVKGPTGK